MHGINRLELELELKLYIKVLPNIFALYTKLDLSGKCYVGEYYVDEMSCRRYVMSGRWVVAEIGCRGYGLSGYGFGEMLRWGKGFSLRNLDVISDISLLANLANRINVSLIDISSQILIPFGATRSNE